jgi:hypothetical protein
MRIYSDGWSCVRPVECFSSCCDRFLWGNGSLKRSNLAPWWAHEAEIQDIAITGSLVSQKQSNMGSVGAGNNRGVGLGGDGLSG